MPIIFPGQLFLFAQQSGTTPKPEAGNGKQQQCQPHRGRLSKLEQTIVPAHQPASERNHKEKCEQESACKPV